MAPSEKRKKKLKAEIVSKRVKVAEEKDQADSSTAKTPKVRLTVYMKFSFLKAQAQRNYGGSLSSLIRGNGEQPSKQAQPIQAPPSDTVPSSVDLDPTTIENFTVPQLSAVSRGSS